METLRDALRRFERAGFRDAFRAEREGLRAIAAKRTYAPEELVIDEVARFEGDTDPQDEAVLFAVRIGLTLVAAVTSYVLVEQPVRRLRTRCSTMPR